MKINLKTSKNSFYLDVFTLLNAKFLGLKPQELLVLSELYKANFELMPRVVDENLRMNLLFSKDYKKDLCKKININYYSLMNSLSSLRKKGFIVDNKLNKMLYLDPTKLVININIVLNDSSV